jgi:predicted DNA-binding protein with PD1-like motif/glutaredoxin
MRALSLHLEPGSDVRRSLEQLAREQGASGFVLGVVGNLSQAAFQCPGRRQPTVLNGELEIITLQGTLAPEGVHLHLSFSDPQCQVWGGHLEHGTLVLKGADLLVGFLDDPAPSVIDQSAVDHAAIKQAVLGRAEPRVALAVSPDCPFSRRALRLLRTLGIPHRIVDPQPGLPLPQISIDGDWIGGYDALAELHGNGQLEALRQA